MPSELALLALRNARRAQRLESDLYRLRTLAVVLAVLTMLGGYLLGLYIGQQEGYRQGVNDALDAVYEEDTGWRARI